MKNKVEDLRNHLFEMLEMLKDPEQKVDIERFKLANDIAQTVINSAKAEIEFIKHVGGKGSGFIPLESATPRTPERPYLVGNGC